MSTVYKNKYDYPAGANRYRLVISEACPYAQRTVIARSLLGLEDIISLAVTSPIKTDEIWDFSTSANGVDPVLKVEYLKELYLNTDPNYDGIFSVPALIDTTNNTVVNQESLDIIYDFNKRFAQLVESKVNLYPSEQLELINEWIDRITTDIMTPPYRVQFTKNQAKYDANIDMFFTALSDINTLLSEQDFLLGDTLTAADIVLYTPLIRFDVITYPYQGMNKYHLKDFPHLWRYLQKLHQMPEFNNSTNFDSIRKGLFLGKNGRDNFGREILPAGPDLSNWE